MIFIVRLEFESKDWKTIIKYIMEDYGEYHFYYLNNPDLKRDISHLDFKYIGSRRKFDEMVKRLKDEGIKTSVEENLV